MHDGLLSVYPFPPRTLAAMTAELISVADAGAESVHGLVVWGVWRGVIRIPIRDGQWKLRVFGDRPPEIRAVLVSPAGLTRHWTFARVDAETADLIEKELGEWLGG